MQEVPSRRTPIVQGNHPSLIRYEPLILPIQYTGQTRIINYSFPEAYSSRSLKEGNSSIY